MSGPFDTAPPPLSRRERAIVLGVALFCAATRLLAVARSPWEWDEVQFILAMRDFDVTAHQPHPPGFPLFIAMGKLARLVATDDFRALQSVSVASALLLFPALFFFARELRLRFETSVAAAGLFAFLPNVWFYGGTAFSDVTSVVLVLFAVTFLFRGRRSRNAYWVGALLLALAAGVRPQNLLVGLIPALYASVRRRPIEVAIAVVIGGGVLGAAFGGAIHATGTAESYLRSVREHGDYIARVDSWRSEARPPMWRLFDRFFLLQYQSRGLSILTSLLVIVSLAGSIRERSRPMLWNALTFVPFALFAWAMLDRYSISRFAIGYQPMFALFAADGVRRVTETFWSRRNAEDEEGAASLFAAASLALIGSFAVWTLPALRSVRSDVSPPVQAVEAVRRTLDPTRDRLYVAHTMSRFVDLHDPDFPYVRVIDDRAIPLETNDRMWLLAEINRSPEEGLVFRRERGRLWNIARHHYFEVKLAPLERRAAFLSGWYDRESDGIEEWRWMGREAVLELPPSDGETMLRLHLTVPEESVAQGASVDVRLNGAGIARAGADRTHVEIDTRVMANGERPNLLEISIDRTVPPQPGGDPRELGLRLRYLAWGRP